MTSGKYIPVLIIARKRSLGQGNIFAPVCLSVHGGRSAPLHAGIPPGPEAGTPQDQRQAPHPQKQTHPRGQTPLGADTPQEQTPPRNRLPGADTPPGNRPPPEQTPPLPAQIRRYGQQAGGTHPTGMQSCLDMIFA